MYVLITEEILTLNLYLVDHNRPYREKIKEAKKKPKTQWSKLTQLDNNKAWAGDTKYNIKAPSWEIADLVQDGKYKDKIVDAMCSFVIPWAFRRIRFHIFVKENTVRCYDPDRLPKDFTDDDRKFIEKWQFQPPMLTPQEALERCYDYVTTMLPGVTTDNAIYTLRENLRHAGASDIYADFFEKDLSELIYTVNNISNNERWKGENREAFINANAETLLGTMKHDPTDKNLEKYKKKYKNLEEYIENYKKIMKVILLEQVVKFTPFEHIKLRF